MRIDYLKQAIFAMSSNETLSKPSVKKEKKGSHQLIPSAGHSTDSDQATKGVTAKTRDLHSKSAKSFVSATSSVAHHRSPHKPSCS